MKLRVRCTYEIDIEIPDGSDMDNVRFSIEDNGCPGTGRVGSALDQHMQAQSEAGFCWACALGGKNEIVGEVK